jgi:hypothetical protein
MTGDVGDVVFRVPELFRTRKDYPMASPPVPSSAGTRAALSARLKGFSSDEIKRLADKLDKMSAEGMKVDDVFPMGIIINNADGVEIRGHTEPDRLAEIVKLIPAVQPKAISIFPRGIIAPDRFRVHVQLQRG